MDFGYIDDHLTKTCSVIDLLLHEKYQKEEMTINYNGEISICTWNVWGLKKYSKEFMDWSLKKRLNEFINEINKYNIDIICLQEVSTEVYNYLKKHISKEYYFYETEINIDKTKGYRNRNLEILFISKYPALKYSNYSIGGNLGYNNQVSVLEYDKLIIYGIYLQAGSKFSIGQEEKAHFYTRCRSEQLIILDELIKTYEKEYKYHCILGDFNFHLDGHLKEWKEVKYLNEIKTRFIDSYRYIHNDIKDIDYYGYTEDTDLNHMRYNCKFLNKNLRYDGILVSNNIDTIDSFIIGKNEILLNERETQSMVENIVYKSDTSKMKKNKHGLLSLWASDHFGVVSNIKFL